MAEGYTGGGPDATTESASTLVPMTRGSLTRAKKPITTKTKAVSYSSGAVSDNILAISKSASATGATGIPSAVRVTNTGKTPLVIMTGYETFSNVGTSAGAPKYFHTMVLPGDVYEPPVRGMISTHTDKHLLDGTALDNQAPDSNMHIDSTANADSATATGVIGSSSSTALNLENGHSKYFRVGDLIRLTNEIMEVTAVGTGADLANSTLTVKRGVYGSASASDHADEDAVLLPFFNAYHDFDKYTVAQTDASGRFKSFNFFGKGRNLGAVGTLSGITPGSVAFKFYEKGAYQTLGLSGISANTPTGLTASETYYIKLSIDGVTATELSFTTDSSNANFGGPNGLIEKIQKAIDDEFIKSSSNLFEKSASVALVNGDVRFTSGSNKQASAIALTAGVSGSGASVRLLSQQNGRIPALANINSAVPASLHDDVIYSNVTYETSTNSNIFAKDDGRGRIYGRCNGTINYETGAIDLFNAPPNAEFVYSAIINGAFSGKLESEGTHKTALTDIYANTFSLKCNGSVKVETF